MKKSLKNISIKDLAGLVSSHLEKANLSAVLTGGACVTIYSKNKYQSLDLDFVTYAAEDRPKEITAAMKELGFKRADEGFFERQDCKYIVEFLPPPLAIGSEPVHEINEMKTRRGRLKLLCPTDCVKDRLAAYYHWNDPQSLEQAIMVAKKQK
ncbi:MAG: hypothetical protein KJ811_00920, partial [Candidatus Margulisbacteria bacterium]|nr:hypothetical protein [Candidatus Margulisiibacteriota bacterium]